MNESMTAPRNDQKKLRRDLAVAACCGVFVAAMVGAAYTAVPLYNWFCRTTGFAGALYGGVAVVTGAIMLALAWQVLNERRPSERASRNLFAFSILFLFLLFVTLLVERGWGGLIARLTA